MWLWAEGMAGRGASHSCVQVCSDVSRGGDFEPSASHL